MLVHNCQVKKIKKKGEERKRDTARYNFNARQTQYDNTAEPSSNARQLKLK
jgi:hypothetical protein